MLPSDAPNPLLTCPWNDLSASSRVKRQALQAIEACMPRAMPPALRERAKQATATLTAGLRHARDPAPEATAEERAARWAAKAEAVATLEALEAVAMPHPMRARLRVVRERLTQALEFSGAVDTDPPAGRAAFALALDAIPKLSDGAELLRTRKLLQLLAATAPRRGPKP